jgi:hypothetical protein
MELIQFLHQLLRQVVVLVVLAQRIQAQVVLVVVDSMIMAAGR